MATRKEGREGANAAVTFFCYLSVASIMVQKALTHMTTRIPVWLRVEVTGVHSVVGWVDSEKLPLVQTDQLQRLQL